MLFNNLLGRQAADPASPSGIIFMNAIRINPMPSLPMDAVPTGHAGYQVK
jgi:hypothetical protein